MRVMSQFEAATAMRLAEEVHSGSRRIPENVQELNRQIQEARRKAELFMARTGAVDMTMVNDVVALMLRKDSLYADWAASEAS